MNKTNITIPNIVLMYYTFVHIYICNPASLRIYYIACFYCILKKKVCPYFWIATMQLKYGVDDVYQECYTNLVYSEELTQYSSNFEDILWFLFLKFVKVTDKASDSGSLYINILIRIE